MLGSRRAVALPLLCVALALCLLQSSHAFLPTIRIPPNPLGRRTPLLAPSGHGSAQICQSLGQLRGEALRDTRKLVLRGAARGGEATDGEGNGEKEAGEGEGVQYEKALEDMTLEDIEALPPLGEVVEEGVDSLEDLMVEDRRFGMKMQALRGEFDPEEGEDDDEKGTNLASALMMFPGPCQFKLVARNENEGTVDRLLEKLGDAQGVRVLKHTTEERMKGKFVSMEVEAHVLSAEAREEACEMMKSDDSVKMVF